MARSLATLLSNDHPLFAFNLHQLEIAVGGIGIDVRLLGDIMQKGHAVMRELGIDTADTTAEELYHALGATIRDGRAETLLSNTHYVIMELGGELVSFCRHDVTENTTQNRSFSDRKIDHAQRHLRAEVIERYAAHDRTDNKIVHQLAEQAGFKLKEDGEHIAMDEPTNNAQEVTNTEHRPSILMIGDIFTDAFIKLDEEYAFVEKDENGKEWLKLPFGDKPPYETVDIVESVGPSPNSAVSCARLGLDARLMAWLGDDEPGRGSMEHLKSEHVKTDDVVTQEGQRSSYWYVLRHGTDRTMLVKSESYNYEWNDPKEVPEWIYLAYIGADSWQLHEGLLNYLETHPEVKFVFQPATYHFEWGVERLASLYRRAYMTVMNREEAQHVTGKSHDDLKGLAGGLHDLGPDIAIITDGAHGSYASYDGHMYTIPNYPDPAPPLDRTGAGDAFASTLTAALALGKDLQEALTWAPVNSASVVQQLGAQKGLLTLDELKDWLSKAPDNYIPSEI